MSRGLEVRRLGLVDYGEALELQRQLIEERRAGSRTGHSPPSSTSSRHYSRREGPRRSPPRSRRRLRPCVPAGVAVFETGRGGDVTYHGPGQLVGYPIIDLRPDRCDVHRYVRDIEEALIQATRTFGVDAGRVSGLTGIWAGRLRSWRRSAFAFPAGSRVTASRYNVTPDLDHFTWIVPCGIGDRGVTSLRLRDRRGDTDESGRRPHRRRLRRRLRPTPPRNYLTTQAFAAGITGPLRCFRWSTGSTCGRKPPIKPS